MKSLSAVLKPIIIQNQATCSFALIKITPENRSWRLNKSTASVGFIYRHIGEIQLLLGTFLGESTTVVNTTMGFQDTGQGTDLEISSQLWESGYHMLLNLAEKHPEDWWMEQVETPFFGTVTRLALMAHILNHNAHHCGQISLTLSRHSEE